MIDNIYVFDDIIEKPYQELIKETLIGGDKPPNIDKVEELDVHLVNPYKFNGCGLIISSDLVKISFNSVKNSLD